MKKYRSLAFILFTVLLFLALSACEGDVPEAGDSSLATGTLPQPDIPIVSLSPQENVLPELTLDSPAGVEDGVYRLLEAPLSMADMELSSAQLCSGTPVEAYRQYDAALESFTHRIFWGENQLTISAEEQLSFHSLRAEEGGLWGICYQGNVANPDMVLRRWGWDGTCLVDQPISSFAEADSACDLCPTAAGLLLLTEGELICLTEELEIFRRLTFDDTEPLGYLVSDKDGGVWCRRGSALSRINTDNLSVETEYKVPSIYQVWPGNGDYDLYLTSAKSLFGLLRSEHTARELLIWENAEMTAPIAFLGAAEAGYNVMQRNPFTLQNELLTIQPVPQEESGEKTALILAVTTSEFSFTTSDTYSAIQYFNQRNDKYRISVVYYYGDSVQEAAAQIQQMKMDILTGEQIDLLLFNNFDSYSFVAQGLLEDLYPFLDSDPEISREDLSPSLLSSLEEDGKLLFCSTGYSVTGYVGLSALVGSSQGWSLQDFAQVVQSVDTQAVTPIADFSGTDFLYMYMLYNYDHFVDTAKGTCNFNCQEFRLLLELCRDYFPATAKPGSILEGTAILERAQTVPTYNSLGSDLTAFGEGASLVGFPGAGGNGGVVQGGYDTFSMLSTSKNKDGVWEFLKFLWSPTVQTARGFECPARIESMDTALDRQVYQWGNLTGAEAELTRDYYLGATARVTLSAAIHDIVMEEAQALLAGDKSIDDTIAIIQNRSMIYLSEQS